MASSEASWRASDEPPQQYFQLGAVEARVAPLDDVVFVVAWPQLVGQLGRTPAVDAMDVLDAVELAADVDQAGTVDLLEEDHRHTGPARGVDDLDRAWDTLFFAAHVGDARVRAALLHVDDDDDGLPDDHVLFHSLTSPRSNGYSAAALSGASNPFGTSGTVIAGRAPSSGMSGAIGASVSMPRRKTLNAFSGWATVSATADAS